MGRASDLLVVVAVAAATIWLDVPRLLLPALFLSMAAVTAYRWRREGAQPLAAERYRARLVLSCVAIGVISIPLILHVVPPNGVYGFRTHLTTSRADLWYPANAFMGWALLVAAVFSAAALMRVPMTRERGVLLAVFLVPLLAALAASYTYLSYLR